MAPVALDRHAGTVYVQDMHQIILFNDDIVTVEDQVDIKDYIIKNSTVNICGHDIDPLELIEDMVTENEGRWYLCKGWTKAHFFEYESRVSLCNTPAILGMYGLYPFSGFAKCKHCLRKLDNKRKVC